jgi:hypothetical protein
MAEWNRAINIQSLKLLHELYGKKIDYFSSVVSNNELVAIDDDRFNKARHTSQKIRFDHVQLSNAYSDINHCFVFIDADPEIPKDRECQEFSIKKVNGKFKIVKITNELEWEHSFKDEPIGVLHLGESIYEYRCSYPRGYNVPIVDSTDLILVRVHINNTGTGVQMQLFSYDEEEGEMKETPLEKVKYEDGYIKFQTSERHIYDDNTIEDFINPCSLKIMKDYVGFEHSCFPRTEGRQLWKIPNKSISI